MKQHLSQSVRRIALSTAGIMIATAMAYMVCISANALQMDDIQSENENNLPETVSSQIIATEVVDIRENPSTADEIVGEIPIGTKFEYISIITNEDGEEWLEVSYEDVHGYVKQNSISLLETPIEEESASPEMSDAPIVNIDIDQIIETARQYRDENPQQTAKADAISETQEQEQPDYEDGLITSGNTEETLKNSGRAHVDAVIVISLLGILACALITGRLFGKMIKAYRQTVYTKG